MRPGNPVPFTQGIERIALARMHRTRKHQGVAHLPLGKRLGRRTSREFSVEEGQIKGGVVDKNLGAIHEGEKVDRNILKACLARKPFPGEPMHLECSLVDLAFRIKVAVPIATGDLAIAYFHAGDLDNPVTGSCIESGGFGVKHDLSHGPLPARTPSSACAQEGCKPLAPRKASALCQNSSRPR